MDNDLEVFIYECCELEVEICHTADLDIFIMQNDDSEVQVL